MCIRDRFSYEGECYESCVAGTVPSNSPTERSCASCPANCDVCAYGEGQLHPEICTSCSSGYTLTEESPFICIPVEDNSNEEEVEEEEEEEVLPIAPSTIIEATVIATVAGVGTYSGGLTVDTNCIVILNYMAIYSYTSQIILALLKKEVIIFFGTLSVMVVQTVLNIIFVFKGIKGLNDEFKSYIYSKAYFVPSVIILILSVPFTLQTTRAFFAEFIEIKLFHFSISDNEEFMSLLNKYSFIQAAAVELFILIVDIYGLARTSWGTRLNRTIIESSALSLSLLVLLLENSIRSQLQIFKDRVIPVIPIRNEAENNPAPEETSQHEAQNKIEIIEVNSKEATSMRAEGNNELRLFPSQRELLVKVEDLIKEAELPEEAKDAAKGKSKMRVKKVKRNQTLDKTNMKGEARIKKADPAIEAELVKLD
eukprot:TRINITY_DN1377_c0_g2_i1.p1 TRINITY_DN1377_c0_g2~~TRINITY_DN1377_c0_g2_i1.p1  ORF type:complete len:425 (+),score=85.46 TRINITY_DN1377_c0_g2_i1:77-1351(+)